jgi:hypothetical protein
VVVHGLHHVCNHRTQGASIMDEEKQPDTIAVTRTSLATGVTRTLDLPITQEQLDRYEAGELLQHAFPDLRKEDREFIKTGITAEEWEQHIVGIEPFDALEPEIEDDKLYLLVITPETLGVAIDLLSLNDTSREHSPEEDSSPEPGKANDLDVPF